MERVATIRVLFADTDAMGIAYYGNYLRWFETGRAELMRKMGLAYRELTGIGVHLPVTEMSIRYLSPARYDDLLAVRAEVRNVSRASIVFGYRIEKEGGTLLADGMTVHAFTDGDGRIVRVPGLFVEKAGLGQPSFPKGGNRGTKPGT